MAANVFHRRPKSNSWGVGVQADRPNELNSSLRVGRAGKFDFALLSFRNLSKGKGAVVDDVRPPCPMLFVVISFRQEPQLVAAIVEPFAVTRRQILSRIFRVDEEIRMSGKSYLHQSPAVLRHNRQLHPVIGDLLRLPAPVIRGFNAARRTGGRTCLRLGLGGGNVGSQGPKQQETENVPRHPGFS